MQLFIRQYLDSAHNKSCKFILGSDLVTLYPRWCVRRFVEAALSNLLKNWTVRTHQFVKIQ